MNGYSKPIMNGHSSVSDLASSRPTILHIGDPIKYNQALYDSILSPYHVIRPSTEERERPAFLQALRDGKWGEFAAILRPEWNTGGEMGRWDSEMVGLLPGSVRVFASAGAGYDWADVDVLAEKGILYCNSAAASTEAVADFALILILSTFRNLPWCIRAASSLCPTAFSTCHATAVLTAHNPRNHILGIIGLGNIGFAVAHKAHVALGMNIHYFDRLRETPETEQALNATFCPTLEELLAKSDCVVLCIPGGKCVLTKEMLGLCKEGARIVNVARGGLLDEEALAEMIELGGISAAALDVHENEPKVNARLLGTGRCLVTCHNAGGTRDTHVGFEEVAMRSVVEVLEGRTPATAVNANLIKKA